MNRDTRMFMRVIAQHGFGWERRRSGHVKIVAPDGAVYHSSSTPSDWRHFKNLRAWARKHGLPRNV